MCVRYVQPAPEDVPVALVNPDNTEPETPVRFLYPYPSQEMESYPVSRLVNSPANDTKEVIEKVGN
jgi:putative SOS response-associated peptidase YedK